MSRNFASRHQPAAQGQHAPLAARQAACQLPPPFAEPREQPDRRSPAAPCRVAPGGRRRRPSAGSPVTVISGKSRSPCGMCTTPAAAIRSGRQPGDVLTVQLAPDRARGSGSPEIARSSVVLPWPLGPSTTTPSPRRLQGRRRAAPRGRDSPASARSPQASALASGVEPAARRPRRDTPRPRAGRAAPRPAGLRRSFGRGGGRASGWPGPAPPS